MLPLYHENQDALQIEEIPSVHFSPHLHQSIEIVYITKGTLELGTGIDLFHMNTGDLGIIFPGQIHHYQVFDTRECRAVHLLASPSSFGAYQEILLTRAPVNPVIPASQVHPDTLYALRRLQQDFEAPESEKTSPSELPTASIILSHAWIQVILSRSLPLLSFRDRIDPSNQDLVYQAVAYVAGHYRENLSLTQMASDLGVSPYALSRIFSATFHQNFNHYVNEMRLSYAAALLADSDSPITDIYLDSGFQSQATFNRVFQARYHLTPREYRKNARKSLKKPLKHAD
jgi:AraC-like DNA-binding protein